MGEYAYMGDAGRREVTTADIRRAIRLFWVADALLMALLAVVAGLLMGVSRL